MPPLQDITNDRTLMFREENITTTRETTLNQPSQRLQRNNILSSSTLSSSSFSTSSIDSSRGRSVRFPSRLSLKSYTDIFGDISSDEMNNSSDDDCFLESSFDNSYNSSNKSISCKRSLSTTDSKRRNKRLSLPMRTDESQTFKSLHPISKNQLVDLVCDVSKLIIENNEVTNVDVDLLITREEQLLKNIKKALPDRVYGSTRDAVSFKRVEVHLLVYKQEILKQLRVLFDKCHWSTLIEYIFKSWHVVKRLPTWNNSSHNIHKEQIFNIMASYFRKCLKLGNFDNFKIEQYKKRLYENQNIHKCIAKLLICCDNEKTL